MIKTPVILVIAATLAACGGPESATVVRQPPAANSAPAAIMVSNDCRASVRDFLEWYYQNQERLATYVVLNYPQIASGAYEVPPGHVSKSGRYELNELGLTQYIALLDSTGFFSSSFLSNKKQELASKASKLASFRANDGPPPGFEADLLLYTQELYEPEDLDNLRLKPSVTGKQASVVVLPIMDRRWEFVVAEQNTRCVITDILFK